MMKLIAVGRRTLALASVVTLAACGAAVNDQATGRSDLPSPQVIELPGVGSGGAVGATTEAASSDIAFAPSASRMAWMTFRYDGEMPAWDSEAPGWSFPAGTAPDDRQVMKLADAFGVSGEIQAIAADEGGGWVIGPRDGSGPAINVSASGTLDWWFQSAVVPAMAASDCAVSSDGALSCPEPAPPVDVPSAADAQAMAAEIWSAVGLDLTSYDIETSGDQWGAYVTGWLKLGGRRSPMQISIGFGNGGAVTFANGFLGTPQSAGNYPRVGVAVGFERLVAQNSGFGVDVLRSVDVVAAPMPQASAAAVTEAGESIDAPTDPAVASAPERSSEPGVGLDPVIEPGPGNVVDPTIACADGSVDPAATSIVDPAEVVTVEEGTVLPVPSLDPSPGFLAEPQPIIGCVYPEPAPIEVVLTGVVEDLTMVWAVDETVWLLPAYSFTSSDGGIYTVNAVADEFLSYGDPDVPVEVPAPLPPGGPAEGSGSAGSGPGDVRCLGNPDFEPLTTDAPYEGWTGDQLVGLCLTDAEEQAAAYGYSVRVVRRDGEDLMVTADFSETRINVETEADVVAVIVNKG